MDDEQVVVYEVRFNHPDFECLVCDDITEVLNVMENELEFLDDAEDQTLTFTVRLATMSKAEREALPVAE